MPDISILNYYISHLFFIGDVLYILRMTSDSSNTLQALPAAACLPNNDCSHSTRVTGNVGHDSIWHADHVVFVCVWWKSQPRGNLFCPVRKIDFPDESHVCLYPQCVFRRYVSTWETKVDYSEAKWPLKGFCLTAMKAIEGNGMRGIELRG